MINSSTYSDSYSFYFLCPRLVSGCCLPVWVLLAGYNSAWVKCMPLPLLVLPPHHLHNHSGAECRGAGGRAAGQGQSSEDRQARGGGRRQGRHRAGHDLPWRPPGGWCRPRAPDALRHRAPTASPGGRKTPFFANSTPRLA